MPYAPLLSDEEIARAMAALPDWQHDGDTIARTIRCASFRAAIGLVNAVADAAEAADHHPDMQIDWRRVTFRLTTHASGGLTRRDVDLAAEIDRLAQREDEGFRAAFPILQAREPERLIDFYESAFGFRVGYRFPVQGQVDYAFLDLAPLGIGIGRRANERGDQLAAGGPPFELWIYADDTDEGLRRAVAAGAKIIEPATDQPWGERVALVTDPEGNRVRIGAESAGGSQPEAAR